MASSNLIYRGALVINGEVHPAGEVWTAGATIVPFITGERGQPTPVREALAREPVLTMLADHRLRIDGTNADGDPVVIEAAIPKQPQGAWNGRHIHRAGEVVAEHAVIQWTTQDVTVAHQGTTVSYPGARTRVVGGLRWIESWDGTERLDVIDPAGGCGCSGSR